MKMIKKPKSTPCGVYPNPGKKNPKKIYTNVPPRNLNPINICQAAIPSDKIST